MNLALDSFLFSQEYPTQVLEPVALGKSVLVKFSPSGDYIASGLSNGAVLIIDYDTLCVVQALRQHVAAIQSFSWSRDGRYLLSASRDWKCVLWDLASGEAIREVRLFAPVYSVSLHPTKFKFAAALYKAEGVVVDMANENSKPTVHILPVEDDEEKMTLSVVLIQDGKYVLQATNQGNIHVVDLDKLERMFTVSISRHGIKSIQLSPSETKLLCNCQDKIIRMCKIPDLDKTPKEEWDIEELQRFEDVVNRRSWGSCGLSHNEEFLAATTVEDHEIVLWDTEMATLQQSYECPKEVFSILDFHPRRGVIAAVGYDTGGLYMLKPETKQRWSALAPDFVELEDNVHYSENEGDFDIYDGEEKKEETNEDDVVDLITPLDDQKMDTFVVPIDLESDLTIHLSDAEA